MFISHCHVGTLKFGSEQDDPEVGTLQNLTKILKLACVDRAVVFAPFPLEVLGWGGLTTRQFDDPNEWLAEELKKYPNLIGFACINPKWPDAPQRLKRAVDMGLVGLKIHPPIHGITINDIANDEFLRVAEDLRMPIHIHTGVHGGFLRTYEPLLIDDIAQRHPNLPIILDHVGGYAMFYQALAVLHNNKNCYVGLTQCSGRDPYYYLPPDRLDVLLKTVGSERFIYGLDYPWNSNNLAALKNDIEWIRNWEILDEDKDKILGTNLAQLIEHQSI